jgi:type IV/VI secretion system ImpK/VasF family protein
MGALQEKARSVMPMKTRGSMQILKMGIQSEEMIPMRTDIRTKLEVLKAKLGEQLNEREVYLVIFPIVVYFDEIVQSQIARGQHTAWPPLQKELYQILDGGEMFYTVLDDILRKPETLPFVYEIFYFCLADGFQGKYAGNQIAIDDYKSKLAAKIPVTPLEAQESDSQVFRMGQVPRFPFWYYAATAALMVGAYAGLAFLA